MKVLGKVIMLASTFVLMTGCLSLFGGQADTDTPNANNQAAFQPKSAVKQPEIIDHKNLKWGTPVPEWVTMERSDIEAMDKYKDFYIFKFETEKAKDLEGAQLWNQNFSAASEISRLVSQRIKDKAASAAAGNKDKAESYTQQLVQIVSQAELHGYKKESEYWVQRRHYTAKGDIEGDFYTIVSLYSIPRNILDKIIADAMNGIEKPKTEDEIKVRSLVDKALQEDF